MGHTCAAVCWVAGYQQERPIWLLLQMLVWQSTTELAVFLNVMCLCLLQVCAGWRSSNRGDRFLGKCVTATVRFVPSYSTKLACQSCEDPWQVSWQVTTAADAWNQQHNWPDDPMWAESDWPESTPDLQLYLHESPTVEHGVLIAGFLVTAAVGVASYAARKAFARHHVAWS